MNARSFKTLCGLIVFVLISSACAPAVSPTAVVTHTALPDTEVPTAEAKAPLPPTETPTPTFWTVDIANSDQDVTVFGEDPNNLADGVADMLGITVAATGDFNGDGYMDILVGGIGADGPQNTRQHAGEAYVVFGSSELAPQWDVAGTNGLQPDVRIYGEETGLGSTMFAPGDSLAEVITTGDVNGDGYDDLVLASPLADGPANVRPDTGAVYVYFGRAEEEWESLRPAPETPIVLDVAGVVGLAPDVVIHGQDEEDVLGCGLATGDVDGDGIEDLVVGACYADGPANGRTDTGAAYVFFGRLAADWDQLPIIDLAISPEKADVVFDGADAIDTLGCALASGEDVNGDGVDDLLIGARQGDGQANAALDAGEVYLFFGRDTDAWRALTPVDLAAINADSTIYGADAGDALSAFLGLWMADVDGDGLGDLLIGTPGADGPENSRLDSGEAYVFLGRPVWEAVLDLAAVAVDVAIYGLDMSDQLGSAIAAGDVNGDGIGDILVGASRGDGPGNGRSDASGEAYVIYGLAFSVGTAIDLNNPEAYQVVIYGEETYDSLGYAVSSGDVNGDLVADLLIGAPYAYGPSNTRSEAGEAYLVLGRR
jgi:hypothetical protein